MEVMEVYRNTLETARIYRKRSETFKDESERALYGEIASHLYQVCADLENTEEINPTKIVMHGASGMKLGEIVERDGRKWKVVDNNSVTIITAEIVN